MSDTINKEAAQEVGFSMNDLVFTMHLFEACVQRGAFRADEMSNVGAVFDRLKAFLIANGTIPNPAIADQENSQGDK